MDGSMNEWGMGKDWTGLDRKCKKPRKRSGFREGARE
jgi:hypothetical protein